MKWKIDGTKSGDRESSLFGYMQNDRPSLCLCLLVQPKTEQEITIERSSSGCNEVNEIVQLFFFKVRSLYRPQ